MAPNRRRRLAPLVLGLFGVSGAAASCRPAETAGACPADEPIVHGACVRPADAERYCGPGAQWERWERGTAGTTAGARGGTCAPRACPDGLVRDEVTGECLGERAVRALAEQARVSLADDLTVGCREGSALRIANGHLRCATPNEKRPPDGCGPGAAFEPAARACIRFIDARGIVDLAAWARALLGADGGIGSAELCARAAVDPEAYGVGSGAEARLDVAIDLLVPGNDVTLARAKTRATATTHGATARPLASTADELVDRAVVAQIELLRAVGGTSSAASISTRVHCPIRGASLPVVVSARAP